MGKGRIKIPNWFWIIAVFFLLWNIRGVISFYSFTFISDESMADLPTAERELYGDYPIWTTIVFTIAVLSGFIGSIGLLLKKKWSNLAFIISLCAIIPQMIQSIFFTNAIKVYGLMQTVTMPIFVIVFGIFLIWFSNFSINKNWLK